LRQKDPHRHTHIAPPWPAEVAACRNVTGIERGVQRRGALPTGAVADLIAEAFKLRDL
jgi:hypothetical protein